jgi:hypothetical protein
MKFKLEHFSKRMEPTYSEMVELAQAEFDKWLSEQQVVYGIKGTTGWDKIKNQVDTHKAYIVCIEPLEKKVCEHENIHLGRKPDGKSSYLCADCGAILRPNWEVVE